jgi:hypothetical protein
MKKSLVLLTFAALLAACRSSNSPGFDESAVMPKVGSEFTYQVVAPQGQLQEITTITNVSNNTFTALRRSDTANNFWTSDSENYTLVASGDLFPTSISSCDSLPLPIATHTSFISPNIKLNGYPNSNSSITFQTLYDGEEAIFAAGTNFQCSIVSETVTVIAFSPLAGNSEADTQSVTHRYWYSSAIGFFVKDEAIEQAGGTTKTDFTRTLVSYK